MELILGGVYQGKLDYARNSYALTDEDIFICTEQAPLLFEKKMCCLFGSLCARLYTPWRGCRCLFSVKPCYMAEQRAAVYRYFLWRCTHGRKGEGLAGNDRTVVRLS